MNSQTKPKIILASNSIGRKMLLTKLGVPFIILPSDIHEYSLTDVNPIKMMQMRARAKAEDVVKKMSSWSPDQIGTIGSPDDKRDSIASLQDDFLIVAADSEAILDGKPFDSTQGKAYGKARDKRHAREILLALMGKTHEFATATSIVQLRLLRSPKSLKELNRWEDVATTRVTLRNLDASSLDAYLSRYDFSRFAAAYTLNETPWDLITKIDGSYTNVIGLPFEVLLPILRELKLL